MRVSPWAETVFQTAVWSARGTSGWALTGISAPCRCASLVSVAKKRGGADEHEPREASGLGHHCGGWLGSDPGHSLRGLELEALNADLHRLRQLPHRPLQLGWDRELDGRPDLHR